MVSIWLRSGSPRSPLKDYFSKNYCKPLTQPAQFNLGQDEVGKKKRQNECGAGVRGGKASSEASLKSTRNGETREEGKESQDGGQQGKGNMEKMEEIQEDCTSAGEAMGRDEGGVLKLVELAKREAALCLEIDVRGGGAAEFGMMCEGFTTVCVCGLHAHFT